CRCVVDVACGAARVSLDGDPASVGRERGRLRDQLRERRREPEGRAVRCEPLEYERCGSLGAVRAPPQNLKSTYHVLPLKQSWYFLELLSWLLAAVADGERESVESALAACEAVFLRVGSSVEPRLFEDASLLLVEEGIVLLSALSAETRRRMVLGLA